MPCGIRIHPQYNIVLLSPQADSAVQIAPLKATIKYNLFLAD